MDQLGELSRLKEAAKVEPHKYSYRNVRSELNRIGLIHAFDEVIKEEILEVERFVSERGAVEEFMEFTSRASIANTERIIATKYSIFSETKVRSSVKNFKTPPNQPVIRFFHKERKEAKGILGRKKSCPVFHNENTPLWNNYLGLSTQFFIAPLHALNRSNTTDFSNLPSASFSSQTLTPCTLMCTTPFDHLHNP